MKILAIESSCDETAAAVVDGSGVILSSAVATQIDGKAATVDVEERRRYEAALGLMRTGEFGQAARHNSHIGWDDSDPFFPGIGVQGFQHCGDVLPQKDEVTMLALDEQNPGRATAERLQPQCARAGKQVDDGLTGQRSEGRK